ncbi:MAG: hypothetical protein H6839_16210 [Planctomycetes bacterium]|nr:hypothetical protein [Planctomycetota bacterium]
MSELNWLQIPHPYVAQLGGLQWSPACDAITDDEGNTLLLSHSLAQFIEGAGANGLVHFAFVLHFLKRLLTADEATGYEQLRKAWAAQSGNLRNAGALFAELTRALPRVPAELNQRQLCTQLRQQTGLAQIHHLSRCATTPPLSPEGFEQHLVRMLAGLSAEDLRHWLRHGRGPRPDGDLPPIDLLPPPARTTGGFLDEALKRKRLAGVAPFVDQMISALTLPPRRVLHSELPVGGYSSVTNRGHPDQILPGEFAVDELEFLRRYAENELLYWRREEPQSQVREDMIVLCDQGVRTWGEPRLALTAAAIALGKRAGQRGTPLRYASTGNGGEPTDEELPALLEASDLSPNPGLALERVLDEPAFELRDVVLLTHPLSLLEEDVRAAARRAPSHVRLFALSVDDTDAVELSELRRGEPVSLRRFQLARPRKAEQAPVHEADADAPWQGPVEPVGFPFRFGLVGSAEHMAMDTQGRRLFTASGGGLLHAWQLGGEGYELLPRPTVKSEVLRGVVALAGVQGGVAALYSQRGDFWLAHYNLVARRVTLQAVPTPGSPTSMRLDYLPAYHCAVVRQDVEADRTAIVIDLDGRQDSPRVQEARARVAAHSGPLPPRLKLVSQPSGEMLAGGASGRPSLNTPRNALLYQSRDGRVALLTDHEFWKAWAPRSDGGLLLKDAFVRDAVAAPGTLAMRVQKKGQEHVLLCTGPDWQMLGEFNSQIGLSGLAISEDGRHVAFRNKPANVVCFRVGDSAEKVQTAAPARHHTALTVEVGDCWFTVYGGKFTHLVRWDRERLEIAFLQGQRDITEFIKRKQDAAALNPARVQLRPGQAGPGKHDPARFTHFGYSRGGLLFLSDNCGQISIFDKQEKLLAMFYVYRGTVAACLVDGTRYGPASITGGPTSPSALGRIGTALKVGSA